MATHDMATHDMATHVQVFTVLAAWLESQFGLKAKLQIGSLQVWISSLFGLERQRDSSAFCSTWSQERHDMLATQEMFCFNPISEALKSASVAPDNIFSIYIYVMILVRQLLRLSVRYCFILFCI